MDFHEWADEQQQAELTRMWENDYRDYTVDWCIENGVAESPDDANIDDLVDEYKSQARDAFFEDVDTVDRARDEVGANMDSFIADRYESNIDFLHHYNIHYETDSEDEVDPVDVYIDMAGSLGRLVKQRVLVGGYPKEPEHWYIEGDSSIIDNNYIGAEVVSSIYPIGAGLDMVEKVFDWMDTNNYRTNSTTGFHVSFSMLDKGERDYDFLKMMMLFDENYTANLFDRLGEHYCKQMRDVLFSGFASRDPIEVMSERQIDDVIIKLRAIAGTIKFRSERAAMNDAFGQSKYFTFRHRANGVVEFRSMGGRNYQYKFDAIRKRIVNMAYLMKVGADPDVLKRDYIKRVYLMLTSMKYAAPDLGSGAGRVEQPFELTSFKTMFDRTPDLASTAADEPVEFLRRLVATTRHLELSPPQIRQLRFYVAKNRITAEQFRAAVGYDDEYNKLASLLRWPLVIPGRQDPRQQPLAFARTGQDLSGVPREPEVVDLARERANQRQDDLPNLRLRQRHDNGRLVGDHLPYPTTPGLRRPGEPRLPGNGY